MTLTLVFRKLHEGPGALLIALLFEMGVRYLHARVFRTLGHGKPATAS